MMNFIVSCIALFVCIALGGFFLEVILMIIGGVVALIAGLFQWACEKFERR